MGEVNHRTGLVASAEFPLPHEKLDFGLASA
jgi:hypothetical protein